MFTFPFLRWSAKQDCKARMLCQNRPIQDGSHCGNMFAFYQNLLSPSKAIISWAFLGKAIVLSRAILSRERENGIQNYPGLRTYDEAIPMWSRSRIQIDMVRRELKFLVDVEVWHRTCNKYETRRPENKRSWIHAAYETTWRPSAPYE